jgi:hypothetical protein
VVDVLKCFNCERVRERSECFYDVTLLIVGMFDMATCLACYMELELLDGVN